MKEDSLKSSPVYHDDANAKSDAELAWLLTFKSSSPVRTLSLFQVSVKHSPFHALYCKITVSTTTSHENLRGQMCGYVCVYMYMLVAPEYLCPQASKLDSQSK